MTTQWGTEALQPQDALSLRPVRTARSDRGSALRPPRRLRRAAGQRRARRDVPRHRAVPPQVERHDDPARAGPQQPGVHLHGRLPRGLAQRGARQHRLGAPARAHDLQQVDRELRQGERPPHVPGRSLRSRRRLRVVEHDDVERPHERLLDAARRQARARDADRGRPHAARPHPRQRAAVRDVGRSQRVRDRREQPGAGAAEGARRHGDPGASVSLGHDRLSIGHRGRQHREAARALPGVLPSRQQRGDPRRRLRRRQRARSLRSRVRRLPQGRPADPAGHHDRAAAGRRAPRRRQAAGQHRARRHGVPAAGRGARGLLRLRGARLGSRRRRQRAAVPGARRARPGDVGERRQLRAARSVSAARRRHLRAGQEPRRSRGRAQGGAGRGRRQGHHRGRAQARAAADRGGGGALARWPVPRRIVAGRGGRVGRLEMVPDLRRPHQGGRRRRRSARRGDLPRARSRDGGLVRAGPERADRECAACRRCCRPARAWCHRGARADSDSSRRPHRPGSEDDGPGEDRRTRRAAGSGTACGAVRHPHGAQRSRQRPGRRRGREPHRAARRRARPGDGRQRAGDRAALGLARAHREDARARHHVALEGRDRRPARQRRRRARTT